MGRLSSVAAAKTTWSIMVRKGVGFQVQVVLAANAVGGGHVGEFAGVDALDIGLVAGAFEVQAFGCAR